MVLLDIDEDTAMTFDRSAFQKDVVEAMVISAQGKNHVQGKIVELEKELTAIRKEVMVLKGDSDEEMINDRTLANRFKKEVDFLHKDGIN
jgi:hypothetical protein